MANYKMITGPFAGEIVPEGKTLPDWETLDDDLRERALDWAEQEGLSPDLSPSELLELWENSWQSEETEEAVTGSTTLTYFLDRGVTVTCDAVIRKDKTVYHLQNAELPGEDGSFSGTITCFPQEKGSRIEAEGVFTKKEGSQAKVKMTGFQDLDGQMKYEKAEIDEDVTPL